MSTFIALLASGVALGAAYALGALGFLVLERATGVINFAQGDVMTLGVYLAYWATDSYDVPVVPAYLFAIVACFGVGVLLERVAYAPVRNRPVITVVITTLGAGIALRALIGAWFGTSPITLPSPVGVGVWRVAGASIPYQRILVVAVGLAAVAGLIYVFHRTQSGRQVRTLAADREVAQLLGIRVRGLSMMAFGVSAALSALAGVLIAPQAPVTITFGFSVMLGSFAAAVLGGFGSFGGVVGAAMLLGIANQTLGGYVFRDYKDAYPFILMVLVIAIRPTGLFSRGTDARL